VTTSPRQAMGFCGLSARSDLTCGIEKAGQQQ
jgi:hypothetical protein